jgi:hypothetical protein
MRLSWITHNPEVDPQIRKAARDITEQRRTARIELALAKERYKETMAHLDDRERHLVAKLEECDESAIDYRNAHATLIVEHGTAEIREPMTLTGEKIAIAYRTGGAQ